MTDVDVEQVSGTVGASQPGGVVGASQVGGTVGARLAQPQANLWTPAELDGLALWLDVWDSDFDLRTDGGTDYVERWGDLSGNGNDAVQGAGSEQPIKDDSIIFDGINDILSTPSNIIIPYTLFLLYEPTTSSGFNRVLGANSKLSQNSFIRAKNGTEEEVFSNGNLITSTHTFSGFSESLVSVKANQNQHRQDGEPVVPGNGSRSVGADWGNLHIGDEKNRGEYFTGNVYFVLSVSSFLTQSDREKLEGWAAHKAARNGIPEPLANLPASHPYKDLPPTV